MKFDVSPDGESLAIDVRNPDGSVRNLEFRHGAKAARIPCNVVYALAHSPDGRFFASNHEKDIRIMDAASGTLIKTLSGHRTTINDLSFSPDGIHLASVSADRAVKVWDWQADRQVWSELAHANSSDHVAFSPDGETLATAGTDNMLRLWRWKLGAVVLELPLADWPAQQIEFSNDGRRIVVIERDRARIYDSAPLDRHD
jgi:WD40 repeat protein